MLRKIQTLNKTYFINWTPSEVCYFLQLKSIRAEQLIQLNKQHTHKLVRQFFLLACQASLNLERESREAVLLRTYAKAIKQISTDYENLFRRTEVSAKMNQAELEIDTDTSICSIDRLQARLFYLITQYSLQPCTHLAGHIVNQLTSLCRHPHIELMPAQQYIYSQSINYWRSRLINNTTSANNKIH